DLMWRNCGVVRNEEGLRRGLDGLGELGASLSAVDVSPTGEGWNDLGLLLDLRSALLTGEATIRGALARTESRGAHNRSDFPELDPSGLEHHQVRWDPATGSIEGLSEPVPSVSEELSSWLARPIVEVGGDRLLE
nr:succinate dehydrogenase [Chloroflexota bacterium]